MMRQRPENDERPGVVEKGRKAKAYPVYCA